MTNSHICEASARQYINQQLIFCENHYPFISKGSVSLRRSVSVSALFWNQFADALFVLQWFCAYTSNQQWLWRLSKWKWLSYGCCCSSDLLSCSSYSTSYLTARHILYIYSLIHKPLPYVTVLMCVISSAWISCDHTCFFLKMLPLLAVYLLFIFANSVCESATVSQSLLCINEW